MKKLIQSVLFIITTVLTINSGFGVEALEHEIKATYLYNFAKFIDWPVGNFDKDPIYFCVMDKNSLKKSLELLTRGKSIKNRPLQVLFLASANEIKGCHVLYVSNEIIKKFPDIKKDLRLRDLLSVGEAPDFIDFGGQIQFYIENNNVSFEIDLSAIKRSGLKLDARVLNIAKVRK